MQNICIKWPIKKLNCFCTNKLDLIYRFRCRKKPAFTDLGIFFNINISSTEKACPKVRFVAGKTLHTKQTLHAWRTNSNKEKQLIISRT
jgi:hypothetical protein